MPHPTSKDISSIGVPTAPGGKTKRPPVVLSASVQRLQKLFGKIDPTTGKVVDIITIGKEQQAKAPPRRGGPVGPGKPFTPTNIGQPVIQPPMPFQPVPGGPGFKPPAAQTTRASQESRFRTALENRRRTGGYTSNNPADLRAKAQALRMQIAL